MAEEKVEIFSHTAKFGYILPNTTHFNDFEKLKEQGNPYNFRVTKVKIFTEERDNKKIIKGIQFVYKNLVNGKEYTPGPHIQDQNTEGFEEIKLGPNEYLTDFHVRWDKYITEVGFDTNKNQKKLIGEKDGNDMIINLAEKKVMVLAPFGSFQKELESLGVFHMNLVDYYKKMTIGYFELKKLIKKKEKWEEKQKNLTLDEHSQLLVRVCNLPDGPFNSIIKYCLI